MLILLPVEILQCKRQACSVFGSHEAAREWMRKPAIGLNRAIPNELLGTATGAQLVDTYLDQIEYCVFV